MKKILLSIVALLAAVSSVNAEEPLYTAVGATAGDYYDSTYGYTYAAVAGAPTLTDLEVEVYADKYVIKKFWGVEGYDLVFTTDDSGIITSAYNSGKDPYASDGYNYVYTGYKGDDVVSDVGIYVSYSWAWSDADTKSGGVVLGLYTYKNSKAADWGYYYIAWPASATGISGVTVDEEAADAPTYNLAGQRVAADTKGLVIKNGKKYVNK